MVLNNELPGTSCEQSRSVCIRLTPSSLSIWVLSDPKAWRPPWLHSAEPRGRQLRCVTRRGGAMASKGDTKPGFLCPAYDPASSPVSAGRPPRPPGEDGPAESTVRSSPEPPPRAPTSARGASPSPLQRRLRPSQGTSEVSSEPYGMDAHLNCTSICKSVHALGTRELRAPASEGTGASQARTPASTRPSSAGASVSAEEMLMQGYIPSTEYAQA
ncbi:hypothetical protein AK812_SmicGene25783 [Symbiodinium microadriaticum]|uniref:Uncharacterized protein n=1 Tax=Symbiodinium microadriaticum TaxID=2951 RepID=A0A1Q9DB83_SYMMI|nr:hypothetical protein AK812_SmicGene25783 [Symbiodinium microadriaticum]